MSNSKTSAEQIGSTIKEFLAGIENEVSRGNDGEVYVNHSGVARLTGITVTAWQSQILLSAKKALDSPPLPGNLNLSQSHRILGFLFQRGYTLAHIASWRNTGTPLTALDLICMYYAKYRQNPSIVVRLGGAKQIVEAYLATQENQTTQQLSIADAESNPDPQNEPEQLPVQQECNPFSDIVEYTKNVATYRQLKEQIKETSEVAGSAYRRLVNEGYDPEKFEKALSLIEQSGFNPRIDLQGKVLNIQLKRDNNHD